TIIIDSETSSYTSSNDIVSSKGPYKYLLKWYDDITEEEILEFKFSKSTTSKSKEVLTPKNPPQPFGVRKLTVGSVSDHERKWKRKLGSDN
ncbi:hypothetical protein Tco_0023629, partial [Tanacetum coccineum]